MNHDAARQQAIEVMADERRKHRWSPLHHPDANYACCCAPEMYFVTVIEYEHHVEGCVLDALLVARQDEVCGTCGGRGCEYGCGNCEMSPMVAGPDAHKVCRDCHGRSRVSGGPLMILAPKQVDGWRYNANGRLSKCHPTGASCEHNPACVPVFIDPAEGETT